MIVTAVTVLFSMKAIPKKLVETLETAASNGEGYDCKFYKKIHC